MGALTKKRMIRFVDLQKYAGENSYTVKKIKSRCFMWKKNNTKAFRIAKSVKETFEEISAEIEYRKSEVEYRKVCKTFRLLSEGF